MTIASDIIDIQIHFTAMMAAATINGELVIIQGPQIQTILASTLQLNCVSISEDRSVVVAGGQEQKLFICSRQTDGSYSISQTTALGMNIQSVTISGGRIFATGANSFVMVYNMTTFAEIQVINTALLTINKISVDQNGETISIMNSDSLHIYKYKHNESAFVLHEMLISGSFGLHDVSISNDGSMMIVTIFESHAQAYAGCNVAYCFMCASSSVCLTCQYGVDEANNCLVMPVEPEPEPEPETTSSSNPSRCYRYERHICMEYCPEECQTCDENKECLSCSQYYLMNEEGKC